MFAVRWWIWAWFWWLFVPLRQARKRPKAEATWSGIGDLAPSEVTKQYRGTSQYAKYIIRHAGLKGSEKTIMEIAEIQRIKAAISLHSDRGATMQDRGNPPPGGPSTEGSSKTRSRKIWGSLKDPKPVTCSQQRICEPFFPSRCFTFPARWFIFQREDLWILNMSQPEDVWSRKMLQPEVNPNIAREGLRWQSVFPSYSYLVPP